MEINFFLKVFTKKKPESLMDHIQRMSSGEATFFPLTLSYLYSKLARNVFTQPIASGSSLRKSAQTGDQGVTGSSLNAQTIASSAVQLVCHRCGEHARLQELFCGLRCPQCSLLGFPRPLMLCPACKTVRNMCSNSCLNPSCATTFV